MQPQFQRKESKILSCCMSFVTAIPVVFISLIIGWSYYAYVVALCVNSVDSVPEKVVYLLFYNPILIVFLWCYAVSVFTKPLSPPREFFLTFEETDNFNKLLSEETRKEYLEKLVRDKNLPVQTRAINDGIRFCNICYLIKPDRAHHCSSCESCVLKMDHHCPWVNNCVGHHNYKYFVIFLGHGFIYCLFVASTSAQYFVKFWQTTASQISNLGTRSYPQGTNVSTTYSPKNLLDDIPAYKFNILFVFFVAVLFTICLVGLFGYHIWLSLRNQTTLESFRPTLLPSGPNKNAFSLGRGGNIRSIFGDRCLLWFLPVHTTKGDGFNWEVNSVQTNYHSMESGSFSSTDSSNFEISSSNAAA